MQKETKISGSFGHYPIRSLGGVLNTMCNIYNIPVNKTDSVTCGFEAGIGIIHYNGKVVAKYIYFEGVPYPIIRFEHPDWMCFTQHRCFVNDTGALSLSQIKLSFDNQNNPVIKLDKGWFNKDTLEALKTTQVSENRPIITVDKETVTLTILHSGKVVMDYIDYLMNICKKQID